MYCKNCGKQLIGTPEYCPNCGAKPLAANSFCQHCGAPTTAAAEICVKCGGRVSGIAPSSSNTAVGGKSKTVSIVLAIFLAFWTWLYTYKRDAWKFWVGLGLSILISILTAVTLGLLGILGFGLWLWAIIDVVVKKDTWYSSYK